MRIRGYRNKDFDVLALLYREFFNEMREWQGWEQLKLDEEEAAETARESLGMSSWVFVAEDSGRLVGFARVQFWDGAYFVREVFVAKAFRRHSIGSRLLTKCEDLVKKRGETSTYLFVEPRHSVSLNSSLKTATTRSTRWNYAKTSVKLASSRDEAELQFSANSCVCSKGKNKVDGSSKSLTAPDGFQSDEKTFISSSCP